MKIADIKIQGVTCNSKAVKKGFAFVAIKGNRQDGNSFIREAISRGAAVVVAERKFPLSKASADVKVIAVKNTRSFFAEACAEFYGHPSDGVKVIGITGTNGKTTLSYLVEAIVKKAKYNCGVIGTINHRFKDKVIAAKNTTPSAEELQRLLSRMLAQGVGYCAMEVSSHSLDQERVRGINFSQAIFTNLTQDHLDYHKNFENYFQAKVRLFGMLSKTSWAILNNDDPYGRRLKKLTPAKVITYGLKNKSDVSAKNIRFGIQGSSFTLIAPRIRARMKINLVGKHNLYNILAAIAWGVSESIDFKIIKSVCEEFTAPPGRLEKIAVPNFTVFVDYAHTPDALYNVITALRPLVKKKLVVIFGCGGQRDKLKRPKMGRIVTDLADQAIITNDNPRTEGPLEIIQDILKGIRKTNYCVIPDRRQAIRAGLGLLQKDDCLIIAGKGHEDYQILKDKVLHFNDREVICECLRSMK